MESEVATVVVVVPSAAAGGGGGGSGAAGLTGGSLLTPGAAAGFGTGTGTGTKSKAAAVREIVDAWRDVGVRAVVRVVGHDARRVEAVVRGADVGAGAGAGGGDPEAVVVVAACEADAQVAVEVEARVDAGGKPGVVVLVSVEGWEMERGAPRTALVATEPRRAAEAVAKMLAWKHPAIAKALRERAEESETAAVFEAVEADTMRYVPRIMAELSSAHHRTESETDVMDVPLAIDGPVVERNRAAFNLGNDVGLLVGVDSSRGMRCVVPFKGACALRLSEWWLRFLWQKDEALRRLVVPPPPDAVFPGAAATLVTLGGPPFPFEFVVRGHLSGSSSETGMWARYARGQRVFGGSHGALTLPDGMRKNELLPHPVVFLRSVRSSTSTAATQDDDDDAFMSPSTAASKGVLPASVATTCAEVALRMFTVARDAVARKGLVLVDARFRFAPTRSPASDARLVVVGETLTPDTARYFVRAGFARAVASGHSPVELDVDFVRRWVEQRGGADARPPTDMVAELSRRWIVVLEVVTGGELDVDASHPPSSSVAGELQEWVLAALKRARAREQRSTPEEPALQVTLEAGVRHVSPSPALADALRRRNAFAAVIDVRAASEPHADVTLSEAQRVPLDAILAGTARLPISSPHAAMLLVCDKGARSSRAAASLAREGYPNVWNLVGGVEAWLRAGLPLEP